MIGIYNLFMEEIKQLSEKLGKLIQKTNLKFITAESCTGGMLGDAITSVPGSSDYYLGGFIAYANDAKERWLGVEREIIEAHGAVSKKTVEAMAEGARRAFWEEIPPIKMASMAVSGIAGPGGGTEEKPVGTVWIAVSGPGGTASKEYHFEGDRREVKEQSTRQALEDLLAYLDNL